MTLPRVPFLLEVLSDPEDEKRRDCERHRVEPVRGVGPAGRRDRATDDRPEREGKVVGGLDEAVRLGQVAVGDECGEPRVCSGSEEARCDAGDEGEPDDLKRARRERQRAEDTDARKIRGDEDRPSRETVDERAGEQAGGDDREEVDDQERADPARVVGMPVHVDDESDERQPGADAGRERREEEETESGRAPHEAERGSTKAADHGPGG